MPLASHKPELTALSSAAALVVVGAALVVKARAPPKVSTPRAKKSVAESSVSYSCKISPEYCDENGRVYGGELLKLIDVAAGVVAAKHAGGPCLTVSLDRVIFLQEIRVSDCVHLSVAVNRAWGTSMEIGVRVLRESAETGRHTYCCHAYLTFVARSPPPPPPGLFLSLAQSLNLVSPSPPPRFQNPEITPLSTLESKRYLLAGRRRAHRIKGSKANDALLGAFRAQLLDIEQAFKEDEAVAPQSARDKEDLIFELQLELMVEAYMRQDQDLTVEGDWVVTSIEGFMEPVRMPLATIQKEARSRGLGGYRKLRVPTEEGDDMKTTREVKAMAGRSADVTSPLEMGETLVMSLWIVRPQHCNSKSILFGGALIRWIEEVSSIAARRVSYCPWSSAAIDSLTFKSAVYPGEVVYVRACVIKVWDSSVECYALVMAEDRNSPKPQLRLVSESFFSLVAIDKDSGRPLRGGLRHVRVPEGPASEVAAGADARREARLQDKRILQRVYA